MLRNYLTSIWRYAARNRSFTGINILGLVIGMSAFMLITQYVLREVSYDKFWKTSDRIYRIQQDRCIRHRARPPFQLRQTPCRPRNGLQHGNRLQLCIGWQQRQVVVRLRAVERVHAMDM